LSQTKTDKETPIEGTPTTPSEDDWIKYGYQERRSSIIFLNDTAKLLFALPSTLSTLYLGLLAGISVATSKTLDCFSLFPIAAWVVAGIFALLALFPRSYIVHSDSPSDIEQENKKCIEHKLCNLRISGTVFLIGVVLAAWRILEFVNRRG
jgi:hypothetical protein